MLFIGEDEEVFFVFPANLRMIFFFSKLGDSEGIPTAFCNYFLHSHWLAKQFKVAFVSNQLELLSKYMSVIPLFFTHLNCKTFPENHSYLKGQASFAYRFRIVCQS